MRCRLYIVLILLLSAVAVDCVDSTKVGLSNARAHEWRQTRSEQGSDVISNGDDSCERQGSVRPDPAPARLNPCAGINREKPYLAAK